MAIDSVWKCHVSAQMKIFKTFSSFITIMLAWGLERDNFHSIISVPITYQVHCLSISTWCRRLCGFFWLRQGKFLWHLQLFFWIIKMFHLVMKMERNLCVEMSTRLLHHVRHIRKPFTSKRERDRDHILQNMSWNGQFSESHLDIFLTAFSFVIIEEEEERKKMKFIIEISRHAFYHLETNVCFACL